MVEVKHGKLIEPASAEDITQGDLNISMDIASQFRNYFRVFEQAEGFLRTMGALRSNRAELEKDIKRLNKEKVELEASVNEASTAAAAQIRELDENLASYKERHEQARSAMQQNFTKESEVLKRGILELETVIENRRNLWIQEQADKEKELADLATKATAARQLLVETKEAMRAI